MYVKNIEVECEEKTAEIEKKVKTYIEKGAVNILKVQVVKNHFVDTIVGCKIIILEKQKVVLEGDTFWPDNIECRVRGKKIIKAKGDNKNETHYSRCLCSNGEQLWVEGDKSTTSKVNGQERHYDRAMNDNEYWWHGGRTNHGNNVCNNTSNRKR